MNILKSCSLALVITCLILSACPTNALSRKEQASWKAFYAKQDLYRKRGSAALKRELARSHANLCAQAESGGQAAIGFCLEKQYKITNQDYLDYVRAIGALVRLEPPGNGAKVSKPAHPQRITFDKAEAAWQDYRELACRSMATQWAGGDQAPVAYVNCRITLTWNHMKELESLYSDLWH